MNWMRKYMEQESDFIDRRTALKLLGSIAAVSSLAGCFQGQDDKTADRNEGRAKSTQTAPDTSTPIPTDTPTETPTLTQVEAPETPEYLKWIPGDNLLGSTLPFNPIRANEQKLNKFRERMNDRAASFVFGLSEFITGVTTIPSNNVFEIIKRGPVTIIKGEFTQREVILHLPNRFKVKSPEYKNFVITADPDETEAFAVIDDLIIGIEDIPESHSLRTVATNVIDTRSGNFPRLSEERPHLKPLAAWIGVHDLTQIGTHEAYTYQKPEGKIGQAGGWTLSEVGINARLAIQFQNADQATDEAVNTALESDFPVASTWTDKTRTHHGPIVVVEGNETFETFLKSEK